MTKRLIDTKDISNIPLLDGTNYGHWHMRLKIHLRSRDLIDVCKKPPPEDVSTTAVNKWSKASYEAINLIISILTERVFREVVNTTTIEKENLLWAKIEHQYTSKRAVNRGRVWMDWQRIFYDGNLQNYIDTCRKLMMELDAVSITVPAELLSYSLLGKLGGDVNLHQFVENLTLNEDIIEKPEKILTRLQDLAHLVISEKKSQITSPTALVSNVEEPHKIVYDCVKGKHNLKCTSHKREDCWLEDPHLRPPRRDKKRRHFNATAHLTTAQALMTTPKPQQPDKDQLILDCGATHHMFNSLKPFLTMPKTTNIRVATGDANSKLTAIGIGTVKILNHNNTLTLKECLYVPKLKCNLISLLELFKKNLTVNRRDDAFSLNANGKDIIHRKMINKLMIITYTIPKALITNATNNLWHDRLGHPGVSVLKQLELQALQGSCLTCEMYKAHKLPFRDQFEPAISTLDCVHMDVVGPINPPLMSGKRYFLTIVDQASSFKFVEFLQKKSDTFEQFQLTKNAMGNSQDKKLKKLISDRGVEFLNNNFKKLSEECGFVHIMAPPETPQHNGFTERANRTILEKARCLLGKSNLPAQFWADAVNTTVFLSNLTPTTSRTGQSPNSLWSNSPARLSRLKTFGFRAIVYNLTRHMRWKLDPPGQPDIFPFIPQYASNTTRFVTELDNQPTSLEHCRTTDETVEEPSLGPEVSETQVGETMDEPTTQEDIQVSNNQANPHLKIIGPRHPTLISADLND
ncbi:hypothetical protein O181_034184 [Austropuccinia psidii MF-1]|uniref:Integrase catalytic domain-containing protein n=1 Tax=Austropuccinia psidii MF-1 TaxID=1389203 RepID=A0A9Q3H998_9BASI|nr:hypothetical protein [Austropuccinia psidii MF-1]